MKSERIRKYYKHYCTAEGNQHIASEYVILKLQQLIDLFEVKSVLEVGLGIGAIAGSLLPINSNLKYSGTEENSFCLHALKKNLSHNYDRLNIFSKLSDVPEKKFDLIIIDGADSELFKTVQLINKRGIIVIEGDRLPQLELLLRYFPKHRFVHSISAKKNHDYSPFPPDHWQGGLKILFVQPDPIQLSWWLKEKINTKIKYLKRTSQDRIKPFSEQGD